MSRSSTRLSIGFAARSPVLVATYLYTCGFDFDRALDRIKAQRPIVQPAPVVLISAKRAFGISPLAIHTAGR
jgi:hypothetical protein